MRITCACSGTAILSDAQRDRTNANCLLCTAYLLSLTQHFSVMAKGSRSAPPFLSYRRRYRRVKRTILIKLFLCSLLFSLSLSLHSICGFQQMRNQVYNRDTIELTNGSSWFYSLSAILLVKTDRQKNKTGSLSLSISDANKRVSTDANQISSEKDLFVINTRALHYASYRGAVFAAPRAADYNLLPRGVRCTILITSKSRSSY